MQCESPGEQPLFWLRLAVFMKVELERLFDGDGVIVEGGSFGIEDTFV